MQDNWYLYCSEHQKTSDPRDSESGLDGSRHYVDTMSIFTYTGISADLQEWSPDAITPITESSDSLLPVTVGVSESFDHTVHSSCPPAAPKHTLPVTLTGRDYSPDAHSRPWWSTAEVHAYAPQTGLTNEGSLGIIQYDSGQVPSGPTDLRRSWSQCGDHRHAVQTPTQPTFRRDLPYPWHPVAACSYLSALPEVATGPTSQVHITSVDNVGPWMAGPVRRQTPSHSNRRRPSRTENVTCDKCPKSMRRQSLRRHIREVHDHKKRPPPKQTFAAPAGP